jgi:hypothetical protein
LLLAYNKASNNFLSVRGANGITLSLYKEKDGEFEPLKNQPISIREICKCNDKILVLQHSGNVVIMNPYAIVTSIVRDTLSEYLA